MAEIERLLGVREAAQAAKEFRRADAVHRQLADHGVTLSYKTMTWRAPGGREGPIAPWTTYKTLGS
jgi:cysteinyl-tRNA synthetase